MIRRAEWTVEFGGVGFRLKPLTVRQRLALSDDLAGDRAALAAKDGKAAGLSPSDLAEFIGEARRKASTVSALYLDCYSLQGQIRVLTAALGEDVDAACRFVEAGTPREATRAALEALGIDTDRIDADEAASSGNG